MSTRLLALAVSMAGCMLEVSASSRTHLGPEQSGAVTTHSVDETALEVTRLFEIRRFMMVDQHVDAPNGERILKFVKSSRVFVAEKEDAESATADDVGSVFYVWVTPAPTGSTVSVLGKPTLAGIEPCTVDGVWLPCTPLSAHKGLATAYLTGHSEADIARGILSELALEGYATGPMPANAPIPNAVAAAAHAAAAAAEAGADADAAAAAARKSCQTKRHEILLKVGKEKDPATRVKLLQFAPTC